MARALGALALAAGALSCSEITGPEDRVSRVEVNLPSATILVGTNAQASARAFDIDGAEVTGVSPAWKSSAPEVVDISPNGIMTAIELGEATITATVGSVSGTATVTVVPLPVVSVSISPGQGSLVRGQSLQLSATLRDQFGEVIVGRPVSWVSSAPGIASVSGAGLVSGIAAGSTVITATAEDQSASITVHVAVTPVPGGPEIDEITPALLVPGGTAVITGSLFSPVASENEVRVAGVLATVTAATTTELSIQLPTGGFGCEPTRLAFVQVARGNAAIAQLHPVQSLPQRNLQPGESIIFTTPNEARCFELAATGGAYAISVYNTATSISSLTHAAFRLRGAQGLLGPGEVATSPAVPLVPPAAITVPMVQPGELGDLLEQQAVRRRAEVHARLLEANLEFLRRGVDFTPQPDVTGGVRRAAAVAAQAPVGSIHAFRIPNVGGFLSGGQDFCVSNFPVHARVVYNGTRAIVVEDTSTVFNGNATFAGQMDTLYTKIGQEFDQLMFGVVQNNFGDPLRMDDQLDNNQRIIMLFSPRINTFNGVAGFVVTCDFANPSVFPSSNRAEVFYATVPTDQGTQFSGNTRANWYRTIRSTVVHETKHIAAFANRIRDFGSALEQPWLEEGTARHAEEIWARTAAYDDLQQGANATYANTLACDVRPEPSQFPSCAGAPWAMYRHMGEGGLYDYLADNEMRSPLGNKVGITEGSYYATSWSLVRWLIDHHGGSEGAFLTGLVRTVQSGVTNLTARAGRPWNDIIGEWSLTMFVDDFPGLTTANSRLRFPSWNLRSIFKGMHDDFVGRTPPRFTREYPLLPRQTSYGDFNVTVPTVAGGSFSMFQLSGAQSGRQLIQLQSPTGGEPDPDLRVAIVRIQ